ncbi:hypothetical protein D3C71_1216080 [compost metagenome]
MTVPTRMSPVVVVTDRSSPALRLPRLIEPACFSQMPPEAVAEMLLTWVFRALPAEPIELLALPHAVDNVRSPAVIFDVLTMPWMEPPVV